MQILVKTLHGKQFKRDLDPDMTVQEFKEKIEKEEGKDEYPVEHQKLIYEGRILSDANKLVDYNIDHKKFIVLLMARPPPAPKKDADKSSANVEEKTSQSQSKSKDEKEIKQPEKETKPTPSRPSTRSLRAAEAAAATNPQPANQASSIQAFTNQSQPVAAHQQSRPPQQQAPPQATAYSGNDAELEARLASITSRPHFANIQQSIQQNPHLLSSLIESLASSDPELYRFISDNPDLFLNALSAMPPPRSRNAPSSVDPQAVAPRQMVTGNEPSSLAHVLPSATEHDRQAIERLKELGFPEYQVVEAYIACDRDEQLAANLLFQMDQ